MMLPDLDESREAIRGGDGEGVMLAVLDSGISEGHPHFASCRFLQSCEVVESGNFIEVRDCDGSDGLGHGTGVAGIIHKLAPGAGIMSIRVLDGGLRRQRHEAIRLGVRHALSKEAMILNCSFGVPGAPYLLPSYKCWTDEAFLMDRHVVTASSNASVVMPEWPGHLVTTHSVTAGDYGEHEWKYRPGQQIAFEAKGVDVEVPSAGGGHACLTGSSFAAAHFTGLLARLLSAFPELSPSQAREIFRRLAK
jgi:subtilisin